MEARDKSQAPRWVIHNLRWWIGALLFASTVVNYIDRQALNVLAPYLKSPTYQNQGLRVVSGQRLIQGSPDILLGWGLLGKTHFYVRQLRDMKGSYEFDPHTTSRKGMEIYCGLCGWALALAHAKSGDAAMIAGYLGKSDEADDALTKYAFAYSKQNDHDYAELKKAARTKRIKVSSVA